RKEETAGEKGKKSSPFPSRPRDMGVENGGGSLIPATVKYSSGRSTMRIPAATDLYTLSGSYTRDAASNTELPRSPASDSLHRDVALMQLRTDFCLLGATEPAPGRRAGFLCMCGGPLTWKKGCD